MRQSVLTSFVVGVVVMASSAWAEDDAEGCKDHPLFTRMTGFYLSACEGSEFDLKRFPRGKLKETPGQDGLRAEAVEVEGRWTKLDYRLNEGAARPSLLQLMRNFANAARKSGGTIEGEYPGWCEGSLDESLRIGNNCTNYGVSMRFVQGAREVFAYAQGGDEGAEYVLAVMEREAMKQDVMVNELVDKLEKEGLVALYINFDTGKATIKPDSTKVIDELAAALKAKSTLKLEIGGHTDNVGNAAANLKLSAERARAVMAAFVSRGVAANRLTARGYGQTAPVADNRTEDGRAKNRRVELTKK